jgi:hypothetical protein
MEPSWRSFSLNTDQQSMGLIATRRRRHLVPCLIVKEHMVFFMHSGCPVIFIQCLDKRVRLGQSSESSRKTVSPRIIHNCTICTNKVLSYIVPKTSTKRPASVWCRIGTCSAVRGSRGPTSRWNRAVRRGKKWLVELRGGILVCFVSGMIWGGRPSRGIQPK